MSVVVAAEEIVGVAASAPSWAIDAPVLAWCVDRIGEVLVVTDDGDRRLRRLVGIDQPHLEVILADVAGVESRWSLWTDDAVITLSTPTDLERARFVRLERDATARVAGERS